MMKNNSILVKTVSFYEKTFADTTDGKEILEAKGITDTHILSNHRIGYSDGSLIDTLPSKGKIIDEFKELGIITKNGKEYFEDCVVFPIMDIENNIISLTGYKNGKYLELPHHNEPTFNTAITHIYPEVFTVDSILDALSLEQSEIPNVIVGAPPEKKSSSMYPLPEGVTANQYLLEHGPEKLKALSDGSEEVEYNGEGFSIMCEQRTYTVIGLEKNIKKMRATVKVEKGGKSHFDTVNFYSAKERRQFTNDVVLAFNETPATIHADIERLMRCCEEYAGMEEPEENPDNPKLTPAMRKVAEAFGKRENLVEKIIEDFKKCGLVGEESNALLSYLSMTSRKMENPLSLMILSSSGAGKSKLQDTCLKFCPPEDLQKLTNLSAKALFYMGQSSIKHKVLAFEEQSGLEEATYAIRNLMTSGCLTTETTIRDNASGKLTTMQNRVEGPCAVMVTNTKANTDPETKSRFIITSISESEEQTQAILRAQRRAHTFEGLKEKLEIDELTEVHRNFQRFLKNYMVVNPFAETLEFDDLRLQSRRLQPQYLNLISTVAFLRQMQKEVKEFRLSKDDDIIKYVEVDKTDIKIAEKLAMEILVKSLDDLSVPGRELYGKIEEYVKQKLQELRKKDKDVDITSEKIFFSRREICDFTGWKMTRLHNHLKELMEAEYIIKASGGRRSIQKYRLVNSVEVPENSSFSYKKLRVTA